MKNFSLSIKKDNQDDDWIFIIPKMEQQKSEIIPELMLEPEKGWNPNELSDKMKQALEKIKNQKSLTTTVYGQTQDLMNLATKSWCTVSEQWFETWSILYELLNFLCIGSHTDQQQL